MKKILIFIIILINTLSLTIACSDGGDYYGGDGSGGYEDSLVDGSDYYGGNDFDNLTNNGGSIYDNVGGKVPEETSIEQIEPIEPPTGGIFDVVNQDIQNTLSEN